MVDVIRCDRCECIVDPTEHAVLSYAPPVKVKVIGDGPVMANALKRQLCPRCQYDLALWLAEPTS